MLKEIIRVDNLAATFGKNRVLKDISFSAYENEITVILGTSGCGKTTLMKHLVGLYPVQQGEVSILGERTDLMQEEEFSKFQLNMGVLFQNGALLNSLSVEENISIALEQHTRLSTQLIKDLVKVKLNLVNLAHAIDLSPEQLSGGMLKRAALARAISMDPPLLFCDEPSAGLDPVTLAGLDELFLKLKLQIGITIILVTHEVSSIKRLADRIIYLEKGRVLFEGPLEKALNSGIPQIGEFFEKAESH
ncbi:MAG: ATP-binding cassette domain-containing protein [Calditrichaeota bacterium]|nr:MAG: ATP-binding cassette domain-containing protein [Calditrichota bacterium]MBL1204651.1 ATP-binding cassette domain-containing protein [Calditrichota bacterium]NOG44479.1 ATP-binding cassette domain-containing protein [Calditrichota bacterium]